MATDFREILDQDPLQNLDPDPQLWSHLCDWLERVVRQVEVHQVCHVQKYISVN